MKLPHAKMPFIHKDKEHPQTPDAPMAAPGYDTTNTSWPGTDSVPVPNGRQVSWLMDLHTKRPSRQTELSVTAQKTRRLAFPNHSDEIVQDLHLFPFSPMYRKYGQGHRSLLYELVRSGPYAARNAHRLSGLMDTGAS